MGIEPTSKAWEAFILPMNYARDGCYDSRFEALCQTRASFLGEEYGEIRHELCDVADKDAEDADHDLRIELLGTMWDDDVGEDGGVGGEVELDEAAVLVLPHEPAHEEHGVRVVDGVLREADADGGVRRRVDDDGNGQPPFLNLDLALKDDGIAVIARLTDLKARDVFLFDVLLECLGRFDHDQSPPLNRLSLFVDEAVGTRVIAQVVGRENAAEIAEKPLAKGEPHRRNSVQCRMDDNGLEIVGGRIIVVLAVDVNAVLSRDRRLADNDGASGDVTVWYPRKRCVDCTIKERISTACKGANVAIGGRIHRDNKVKNFLSALSKCEMLPPAGLREGYRDLRPTNLIGGAASIPMIAFGFVGREQRRRQRCRRGNGCRCGRCEEQDRSADGKEDAGWFHVLFSIVLIMVYYSTEARKGKG